MKWFVRLNCWVFSLVFSGLVMAGPAQVFADPVIIDHRHTDISLIPQTAIEQAKSSLHIAYGHTSHGHQLTTGMTGLVGFMNGRGYPTNLYEYNNGGSGGALDFRDHAFSGANDLGYPDRSV